MDQINPILDKTPLIFPHDKQKINNVVSGLEQSLVEALNIILKLSHKYEKLVESSKKNDNELTNKHIEKIIKAVETQKKINNTLKSIDHAYAERLKDILGEIKKISSQIK